MKFPNKVRIYREARLLTREMLANDVGVTRQTIGLIESGRVNPGTSVAIRIAKTLRCTVEELFDPDHRVMVRLDSMANDEDLSDERVAVTSVNGKLVAKPMSDKMVLSLPASGVVSGATHRDGYTPVRLFSPLCSEDHPILISGCDPGLQLLSQYVTASSVQSSRSMWFPNSNSNAFSEFINRQIHVAAIHIGQDRTSQFSHVHIPFPVRMFHFSKAEFGWVVLKGNPTGFSKAEDLTSGRIRMVNRPVGSGARNLLEVQLQPMSIAHASIPGYSFVVRTHEEVASAVATRLADVGIAHASAAGMYGLSFLPIREETTLLFVADDGPDKNITWPVVDCLSSDRFKNDLSAFGTYNTLAMGQLIQEERL